uniref:Acetylcholine receptor subunit alpha-type unc-63 n=1 Tax=Anisakis simplex TaxID=6269 RepID=A0A346RVS2_ANISI|nr:Nicotinic acetylcholine receptor subunit alpha-type 63 [Anisakis simplex]AXS78315.1 Acetylcholine receptor subunit alpha-type unc-63 [Anisakis simplex]
MIWMCCLIDRVSANKDASRLFEDLLADYNKLVRPVDNNSETMIVRFKLKLSQLLDVHEKNQIMTTNVWLQHSWMDYKLKWNPADYGGVDVLYVPSDMIWLPDIVLYNNADGNYQVTIMTKAKVSSNGSVEWAPPAIYKSMCQIDVEFFPFDAQTCEMKFGSWTYGGLEVDLKHKDSHKERKELETVLGIDGEYEETVWIVDEGIDLSDYYPSVEWDILSVPGKRHEKRPVVVHYGYVVLTVILMVIRLSTLSECFVPLIIISKITNDIIIIGIAMNRITKILVEIIPSTSLVIPLIGKYLLFTMVLVTLSVVVTVITLNVHYRTPTTHTMPNWVRHFFIELLPRYLLMERPTPAKIGTQLLNDVKNALVLPKKSDARMPSFSVRPLDHYASALSDQMDYLSPAYRQSFSVISQKNQHRASYTSTFNKDYTPMRSAIESVTYVADYLKNQQDDNQIIEDWKYISVVMDRIFLFLFTAACAFGTAFIILRAPTIYDTTVALA